MTPTTGGRPAAIAAVVGGALHAAGGHGALLAMPGAHAGVLRSWLVTTPPPTVSLAVVRLVAEAGAWYVVGASLLVGLARRTRSTRLTGLASVVAPAALGRLLGLTTTTGLLLVTGPAPMPTATATATARSATMAPLVADGRGGEQPGTVTMRPATGRSSAVPTVVPAAAPPVEPTPALWEVAPGESFWSIAVDVVAESRGDVDPATIDAYWRRLVEANRDRLADPRNPDLIFVGQVLAVPAVDAA